MSEHCVYNFGGECHRYPPNIDGKFPPVADNCFCGEIYNGGMLEKRKEALKRAEKEIKKPKFELTKLIDNLKEEK